MHRLQKHRHILPILYFSDAGFPPYGTCTKEVLKDRLDKIFMWCFAQGCTHIVVACNAASSVLQPHDEVFWENERAIQRIISIIRPTVAFMNQQAIASLHVIGGHRTIEGQIYIQEGLMPHTAQAAQPLSACIERGTVEGPEIDHILSQVLNPDSKHLLLACTHYEVLTADQLRVYMPLLEKVWYPSLCAYHYILKQFRFAQTYSGLESFTTGDPTNMHERAMNLFGITGLHPFTKIVL